jgi:hypothetical protein
VDALSQYADVEPHWRKTAIITAAIAAIELIALVVIALAFIAKPFADEAVREAKGKTKAAAAAKPEEAAPEPAAAVKTGSLVAKLSRENTSVLVLNGNGITGVAGAAAERVSTLDYPIAGVGDAARRDFPRTIVMYRSGFAGEAERLARDLRLGRGHAVPLDGMRPADLAGAKLALIIGG